MSDRPEYESGERGRTGPLGDDEETRYQQTGREDEDKTRQIPRQTKREESAEREQETRQASWMNTGKSSDEERETRLMRHQERDTARHEAPSRGYYEAAEEREERLRDLYGGIDWLASFLGFVFAMVAGGFLSLIGGLILVPLGFSPNFGGRLGASTITALVIVGILIFLTYFFGGYVAGRLARFDGGRNGVIAVVWGIVISFLLVAVGGFLPGNVSGLIRQFTQSVLGPAFAGLQNLGLLGAAIVLAVFAVMFLGGFAGGRLGSRYHRQIDRTT